MYYEGFTRMTSKSKIKALIFQILSKLYVYEAFWDMIVAFFQQGQNGPDLGWGKTDIVC